MDTELKRPQWRFTANYRLHPRLQAGVEVNPRAEEVGPLLTLFVVTETEGRPALFVGTSSDRIGSPKGERSYYATASKYLPLVRTSFYGSLNYSEWDRAVNLPLGATVELGRGVSIRPMFDGDRGHLMLNYLTEQYGVSLMYVWFERLGLSCAVGF